MPLVDRTTHIAGSQDGICFLDGDYKHSVGKKMLRTHTRMSSSDLNPVPSRKAYRRLLLLRYLDFHTPSFPHDTRSLFSEELITDL